MLAHALAAALLAAGAFNPAPPPPDRGAMPGMATPPAVQAAPPASATGMDGMTMATPIAPGETSGAMAGMDMHGAGQLGAYPATRDASGTAWMPDSSQHSGLHLMAGAWTVMAHGEATLVYDDQGGPRGHTETVVLSHLVLQAQRPLAGGVLTLKGLFSLDPLIGQEGYPLLLQTGETADGVHRLIDRQHPHDLIGELAAAYSHPLGAGVSAFIYGGPAGEPALGPPVYLHRAAGFVDPETPITHHWLDSTHLVFGVVTGGLVHDGWKLEASSFKGREPDEHRYDIEAPALDSWSVRLSWNPAPDWALQISRGHLHSPEELEPDLDQDRTIASAVYNRAWRGGTWQTVAAWGRMDEVSRFGGPALTTDAYLLESVLTRGRDTVFGRVENVTKDEFFPIGTSLDGRLYNVTKLSVGYQRSFLLPHHLATDVGGLVSKYGLPQGLDGAYGSDPTSIMLFTRIRLAG